jgi:Tfp pilus assembly protein PilF
MLLTSDSRDAAAEQRFQSALAIDPSYALAHYQLGRIYDRSARYAEARQQLEKAVALDPELTEAYWLLHHAYLRLGEKDKAREALATFHSRQAVEYDERQEILRRAQQSVQTAP